MKKKSMVANTLVILIIFIVACFVILMIVAKVITVGSGTSKRELCKLSIAAAAKSKSVNIIGGGKPLFDLNCEAQEFVIKREEVLDTQKISKDKVYAKLASEMYSCWDMIGKGKIDPFYEGGGNTNFCMICSEVKFDRNYLKDKDKPKLDNFWLWLTGNNVPGQELNFYQSITEQKITDDVLTKLNEDELNKEIDPAETYYIVWRAEKDGRSMWQMHLSTGLSSLIGPIGAIIGFGTWCANECKVKIFNIIHFVNVQELGDRDFCSVLLN